MQGEDSDKSKHQVKMDLGLPSNAHLGCSTVVLKVGKEALNRGPCAIAALGGFV